MKKSLVFGIFMMMSTIIFAQHHRGHHGQRGYTHVEKMKSDLSLTDQQYADIKSIDEKYKTKHSAIRHDSVARENKSKELKSLREDREKEIKAVLTADQNRKWKTIQKERAKSRREAHEKSKAERTAKLKEALSLSDEQSKKLNAANEKFHKQMKASSKDKTSKEQSKERVQKYRSEHEAEIKSILSADQFEKYHSMKTEKRKHLKRHHDEK